MSCLDISSFCHGFKYVVFYLSYIILLLVIIVTSEQYYCLKVIKSEDLLWVVSGVVVVH